jgi:hypothetical protein
MEIAGEGATAYGVAVAARKAEIVDQFAEQFVAIKYAHADGHVTASEAEWYTKRLIRNMEAYHMEPDNWHRVKQLRNGVYRKCNPLRRSECRCHVIG